MGTLSTHCLSGGLALLQGAAVLAGQERPPHAVPFGDVVLFIEGVYDEGGGIAGATGVGIQAGADHIIGYQCTDGGWGWPHTACPTTTFSNITGPIALGLLRAWELTGDAGTLAAAVEAGDYDVAAVFPNATPSFGSFAPAFLRTLSGASGDSSYSDHAASEFFDELTAGTYGDAGVYGAFFPADTYDYLDRHKTLRSGGTINLRPWDMQLMPWVAGLIGNADSTTPLDGVSQQDTFLNDAVLDGLDTLVESGTWDLLGLAGAIRGLALNGNTTFAAIDAPAFDDIDGLTALCDLADVLVSFQNTNGSWSWVSTLQNPIDPSDEDTQTTAYAVLALEAADAAGCTEVPGGQFTSQIAAGRAWLASMQDVDGGFFSYPGGDHNIEAEAEALHATAIAPLTLATSACENSGTVTVTIDMAAMPDAIVGGQFFLDYDISVLDFLSADPGASPFTVEVFESVSEGTGKIAYAVGVLDGGPGTSAATTMVELTFAALVEVCTPTAGYVSFDLGAVLPTRLTNDIGDEFLPTLLDLGAIEIDETGPVITPPLDIDLNADAGGCDAAVTVPALEAMDVCTEVDTIINDYNLTADASDTYPSGTTVVTWTVTDTCGNESVTTQDVTVNAVNDLAVDVQLFSVFEDVTRCITFELFACPGGTPDAVVEEDITFTAGVFSGTIEVPCGPYTCITARDTLHTLRRTDEGTLDGGDFAVAGTIYVSDFTTSGTTDDSLIGGNLNDDLYIDILDYGIYVGQFGDNPGADTLCTATGPHADINGDGSVFAADFTYITNNFLEASEANCCAVLLAGRQRPPGVVAGPVSRISIAELARRGMAELALGDLNHDGWLDTSDVVAFLNGARP